MALAQQGQPEVDLPQDRRLLPRDQGGGQRQAHGGRGSLPRRRRRRRHLVGSSAPQQHWAVTPTGDGSYFLINRYSGPCLAVDEGSTADGADVEQQPYASLTRQQGQIIAL
ncbi:RICIN domain-containing protein [Streptomyces sp. NRRL S-350]|uniref:RICIN domain-containing protein n=1 Tax=Streptomyces sp. NRRL S-350 TaxID=1463902 RepID=UPI001F3A943A|nr:RICIN domain-containing protein [Streptomyces sp. NRRL S-350]